MKSTGILIFFGRVLTLIMAMGITGCYYDKEDLLYHKAGAVDCASVSAKYSTDVAPLMKNKCATAGCHNAGGSENKYTFTDYTSIMKSITPFNAQKSTAYKAITGKGFVQLMPPSGALPEKDRILIRVWIDQGAKSEMPSNIPDIVIGRLPVYLRALSRLAQEGHEVTSSHELGQRLGISSAQIRKDLSHFGGFGKQGTGYQIAHLIEQLRQVLKVDKDWEVALVGVGDLGSALVHYKGFSDRGFHIAYVFDNSPQKIGKKVGNFTVASTDEMTRTIEERGIRIAMIAVPAEKAQAVADELIQAGVRAILNYAPINLNVPSDVRVQYIDPVLHMQRMTYYLT